MVLRKIDRSEYTEALNYARGCPANRVYPLSIATGTQDGDIYVDGKGCVLFWHYCGFAYISGDVSADVLEEVYRSFLVSDTERRFLLITDSKSVSDYYSGRDLLRVDKRIEYTHSGILEKQPELDDCFVIERITSDNIGVIQGRITPAFSWNDRDIFLRNGFGFMARSKDDGSFAAVAFPVRSVRRKWILVLRLLKHTDTMVWLPVWHTRCVRKSCGRAEDLYGLMQKQIQVLRKRLSASDLSQSV